MLLNAQCYHLLDKSAVVLNSCTYWMTYNICDLHLQMNKVYNFMLSRFSVYRIIIFFSQRQAFTAYRSASSGPVENILPTILMSKMNIIVGRIFSTGPEEADL